MVKIFFFILLFSTLFVACSKKKFPVDYSKYTIDLNLEIKSNSISKLKIPGVYIRSYEGFNEFGKRINIIGSQIFFSNGVYFSGSIDGVDSSKNPCINIDNRTREIPYFWGLYKVTNDTIYIEQVHTRRGLFKKFPVQRKIAIVTNSGTSIQIVKRYLPERTVSDFDLIYHFYPCSHIPSNENIFLKDFLQNKAKK